MIVESISSGIPVVVFDDVALSLNPSKTFAVRPKVSIATITISFAVAPSAFNLLLQASLDNTNWFDQASRTTEGVWNVSMYGPFHRLKLASFTGGSGMTVKFTVSPYSM